MQNLIPTSKVVAVENYPYGFTLKTTLFDSMEFNPKKGYRHVTQTINPKTGLKNKPKASTYSAFLIRYYDENNHIKVTGADFNGIESINKGCKLLADNFELLSEAEKSYLLLHIIVMTKVSVKAYVTYCNSDFNALIPLIDNQIKLLVAGTKDLTLNVFKDIVFDFETMEQTKDKEYNPFKITSHN